MKLTKCSIKRGTNHPLLSPPPLFRHIFSLVAKGVVATAESEDALKKDKY